MIGKFHIGGVESTPELQFGGRSTFADVLGLSGFAGLAAGFALEGYRVLAVDPVLGSGVEPHWVTPARFALLATSMMVLVYSAVLDDLFRGWVDVVLLCAFAGQWGIPLFLYLDATATGLTTLYSFLVLACTGLFAALSVAVAVNYVRRSWPALRLTRSGN